MRAVQDNAPHRDLPPVHGTVASTPAHEWDGRFFQTQAMRSKFASYWRHRQDSADGLECRRLFVPLRKGEILAPEHWQESSLPEMTVRKQ